MRILGLDYGTKRIGVALGDTETNVALPRETIHGGRDAIAAIATLCRRERIERIVLGLPLTMSGEEGKMAQAARAFGRRVAEAARVPVDFMDERLTTRGVPREGVGSADAAAAAAILQTWLERRKSKIPNPKSQ